MSSYTPPDHTPYQWQNAPSTNTPLDAAHLEAAEDDLVQYTQQAVTDYDAYAEDQFVHQDGTGLPQIDWLGLNGNSVVGYGSLTEWTSLGVSLDRQEIVQPASAPLSAINT